MSDPWRTPASKPSTTRRLRNILGKNFRLPSLIPRERRFYDLFEQQAATIVRSASLLERALADVANLPACQREIKALEVGPTRDLTRPADLVRHNFPYLWDQDR